MSETKRTETPVAGTELVLFTSAQDDGMLSTRISWPPHGIEREVCIRLTLSKEEVEILACGWRGERLAEALTLSNHVAHSIALQCAMLRKLQALDPNIIIKPSDVEPL